MANYFIALLYFVLAVPIFAVGALVIFMATAATKFPLAIAYLAFFGLLIICGGLWCLRRMWLYLVGRPTEIKLNLTKSESKVIALSVFGPQPLVLVLERVYPTLSELRVVTSSLQIVFVIFVVLFIYINRRRKNTNAI